MKMSDKMTRRTFLKKGGMLFGTLLAAVYGYSRFLEPRLIQITNRTLAFDRLPAPFHGKRIVQFSDVHLDYYFGMDRMESLLDQIQELGPDMVIFTGDLYHDTIGAGGETCAALLERLEAPLGKWAVLGNHDYIAGAAAVEQILTRGGFTVLTNRWASVEHEGRRIQITGVDDIFHGRPDFQAALRQSDAELFTLMLAHEPDLADHTVQYPIDLQLSGHSHGGQVRLPFIGHLIVPEMAQKYPDGLYELGNGKLLLYTNRGVGVSTHPIRFMCRPEITVITLST
jgi:predicted MPP superfamily phosphohydrolase